MANNTSFWKIAFASAVGILLLTVILSVVYSIMLTSMVLGVSATSSTKVAPDSVLDIDFSKVSITEQTMPEDIFSSIALGSNGMSAEQISSVGILDAVKALEYAAADPKIKYVYLRPDMAGSISHLEEFRNALVQFRSSGKPIISYLETPTNAGFYLASVSDRVFISKYRGGMNMFVGMSGRLLFLKDLLDKLGVNVQLIRHGKYKSAGETYVNSAPSAENLEQNTVMVKGIWKEIVDDIAKGRNLDPDGLNAVIDDLSLVEAEDFVSYGLADEALGMGEMKEKLAVYAGVEEYSDIPSVSLADYAALAAQQSTHASDKIAVIYVDGEIVGGRDLEEVAGKRFADIIDEVADDDDIEAVVLRVNSPGGSVIAASQIKDAVDRLAEEKPVVASYGSYAASGGYWISAGCDYIFSDATTLTGSIGVFGVIPDFSGTVHNIAHVNVTSVNSNAHSDMYSFLRPLTTEEEASIQKDIENIYSEFTSLVADGRNMKVEKVDSLGQGRVWTGRDALAHGLVDRIGGLEEAIEYAASMAGTTSYEVEAYPQPLSMFEQLMVSLAEKDKKDDLVKMAPASCRKLVRELADITAADKPVVYARLPYDIDIR